VVKFKDCARLTSPRSLLKTPYRETFHHGTSNTRFQNMILDTLEKRREMAKYLGEINMPVEDEILDDYVDLTLDGDEVQAHVSGGISGAPEKRSDTEMGDASDPVSDAGTTAPFGSIPPPAAPTLYSANTMQGPAKRNNYDYSGPEPKNHLASLGLPPAPARNLLFEVAGDTPTRTLLFEVAGDSCAGRKDDSQHPDGRLLSVERVVEPRRVAHVSNYSPYDDSYKFHHPKISKPSLKSRIVVAKQYREEGETLAYASFSLGIPLTPDFDYDWVRGKVEDLVIPTALSRHAMMKNSLVPPIATDTVV
jgi:hypothetical protein